MTMIQVAGRFQHGCFMRLISAFRCAYCYFLNPARKTRPQAPRLPDIIGEQKMPSEATLPTPSGPDGVDGQPIIGMSLYYPAQA